MRTNQLKNKKLWGILSLIIIGLIILFFFVFSLFDEDVAENKVTLSDKFPDSYKPYIEELKKQYPNWSFKALYTNLDWNYVISKENVYGKNLVPKSYTDNWKNMTPGQYNVEIDAGWVDSSKQAVEYCMDPRNFLNYARVFQFEELSYNASTNTTYNIEKILYGTEFYNKIVEYQTPRWKSCCYERKICRLNFKSCQNL